MNTIIIAPTGKMGRLIIEESLKFEGLTLVGAVSSKNSPSVGKDIGLVARTGHLLNIDVVDDLKTIIKNCDVIIDFSTIESSLHVLELAVQYKKKLVCGTTGFSNEQFNLFREASKSIPILYAANTSKMIHLMNEAIGLLTSKLGDDVDIEIIEMHDAHKKDAPSGTSLEMGKLISNIRDKNFDDNVEYGRKNKREAGKIGYHSVRAGNIPSTHTIIFGKENERLEITHHAYNWNALANGACLCALFLKDKEKGWYDVQEALKNV